MNTAMAGYQTTTATCRYAEGLGIQTSPAGTSVGFTFKDHDCERFQLAQYLYSRGQTVAGDTLMCKIKSVHDALGADCMTLVGRKAEPYADDEGRNYVPPPVAAVPAPPVPPVATPSAPGYVVLPTWAVRHARHTPVHKDAALSGFCPKPAAK